MMNQPRTFYAEWIPLDKRLFRILGMLADLGEFQGNLSDIYRYLVLEVQNVQTKQRARLKESIEELSRLGFLTYQMTGRTYHISPVPQKQPIPVPPEAITALRNHRYSSENVAWEQVLKVYLWICHNQKSTVTNDMIAADLHISVSTVISAKNVLEAEYNAITRKNVSEKIGDDSFRTLGQELAATAWWNNV